MNVDQSIQQSIRAHYHRLMRTHLSDIYQASDRRFEQFSVQFETLLFDFSKIRMDEAALEALIEWAEEAGVESRRFAMFSGEPINTFEERSVLHTALRDPNHQATVAGEPVAPKVQEMIAKMSDFAERVLSGEIHSSSGEAFTDVVNIGIGGSDLGPMMSSYALKPYATGLNTHFIANVDPQNLEDVIADLNPQTTLVVVSSKTFTTIETMTNAQSVKQWLEQSLGAVEAKQHFAAVTSNPKGAGEWGIEIDRVFSYEDWVGGRYSVWGAVGLPLILSIGTKYFLQFLAGAQSMDMHFQQAPLRSNLPVLLGLIGAWHRNFCQHSTRALLVYDHRLKYFPEYVQQLDMESNGKQVDHEGHAVAFATGPIIWGGVGTNALHSFFQWMHQGSDIVPCEFLLATEPQNPAYKAQHNLVIANALAQSQLLMDGRSYKTTAMQMKAGSSVEPNKDITVRVCSGNRPSTTLLYPQLTPRVLGQIIALYEHRVFVEGCLWNINSFDQWGVELGKIQANQLLKAIEGSEENIPVSSKGLIQAILKV